jgi:CYTH domain-containing protein/CHAD domain-containing protein
VAYAIDPDEMVRTEVRRIALERLDDAIDHLGGDIDDAETAIHEARKRCKELRGLARLIEPALGRQFRPFDRTVRDAARELSPMRDAHALLATFDALLALHDLDGELRTVRDHQASLAGDATAAVAAGDERIATARTMLVDARDRAQRWKVPEKFDTLGDGLEATYRRGRIALRRARRDPTDEHLHEWRKSVKYLWYQMRLLREAAPSVVGPAIELLDGLAEALGDDHDLAVLVARLDESPDRFGEPAAVAHARAVAREQQQVLRLGAFRTGAVVYAERGGALRDRIATYWRIRIDEGIEVAAAGIPEPDATSVATVERERRFLVDVPPPEVVPSGPVLLRQGYLAAGEQRSVRVRDAGADGCTLTVKGGQGLERIELEWPITRDDFDAAWPLTDGQRIEKVRHSIPQGSLVIELDVFGGDLDGLVIAEVEFDSVEASDAFEPPAWFGREVTEDGRYSNASLARHGLPPLDPPPSTFA